MRRGRREREKSWLREESGTHETLSVAPTLRRWRLGAQTVRMGLERFAAVCCADLLTAVSASKTTMEGPLTP